MANRARNVALDAKRGSVRYCILFVANSNYSVCIIPRTSRVNVVWKEVSQIVGKNCLPHGNKPLYVNYRKAVIYRDLPMIVPDRPMTVPQRVKYRKSFFLYQKILIHPNPCDRALVLMMRHYINYGSI